MKSSQFSRLSDLVNIGTLTELLLHEAKIFTPRELEELGAATAWKRIQATRPEQATLSLLYALQGALLGLPGTALPAEVREELLTHAYSLREL